MTRVQRIIIALLSVLACSVVVLALRLWQGTWQQPLGPALQMLTATPFTMPATWTPDPQALQTLAVQPTLARVVQPSAVPTSTQSVGLCGAPPVMNILAIGTDARGDNYTYGLADVIRLVRVDFANPGVTVLEIPRDLWGEFPDIADNLYGADH